MRRWLACVAGTAMFVAVLAMAPGAALAAQSGSGYYVTFVARSCAAYTDIFANKSRNDIMESLEDLGPDSPYTSQASLVDPAVEAEAPQSACTPLPGWEFTLGHGYDSSVVKGPWGSMSKITDPFPRGPIVTEASTPLYDQYHNRVRGQSIAGAVTIELTDAERQQASQASELWAQGGTPDDPVLADKFPGPEYGFGALRCGTDDVNGDNVEYLFFPSGVTHLFCYAFYVVPPPTAGKITIEKRVVGAPSGANPAFAFSGSISYDPNGFTLANGQSQDFYRAGGQTWDVTESPVDSYALSSVVCTATTASGGAGSSTYTVTGSTTAIHLVATEHVTCVYTNTYVPPTGGLAINKITRGGVGRFAYTVTPRGGGASRHAAATTDRPGVPAAATPALTGLTPGVYTITERSPTTDLGRWHGVSVSCNGVRQTPGRPVHVTVRSGQNTACTFVNVFIPAGSISLAKITTGATGTVAFLITSRTGGVHQFNQHATTTQEGVAADAVPNTSTDATDHLPLGRYLIGEEAPASENPDDWTLEAVECNGRLVPFDRGVAAIVLTPGHPSVRCVFTNRFTPTPPPEPPAPPTPPTPPTPPAPPSGGGATPSYAGTDLAVTKQALQPTALEGQAISYRITVHNNGPDAAADVVLADQPGGRATIVSVHTSTGHCQTGTPVICRLGNLDAGASVTIMVRLIPQTTGSTFVNRAVVGGATAETTLANNISSATVRIVRRHVVACTAARAPVARAAC